jgi:hypothetical protein
LDFFFCLSFLFSLFIFFILFLLLLGLCARGEVCKYLHENAPVCRDFMNNKCNRGEHCKYSHQSNGDEISVNTQQQQ